MCTESAGDPGPGGNRRFWGRGRWDANALPHILRDYEIETLADDDAVLVVDETEFQQRWGVARQYTGGGRAVDQGPWPRRGRGNGATDFGVERLIELIKVTKMTPYC